MFEASDCVANKRFIAVKGKWADCNGPKGLISVYAPHRG